MMTHISLAKQNPGFGLNSMEMIGFGSPLSQLNEWIFLDVPSDITVDVHGRIFALHKFPLITKSGHIRKLLSESRNATKIYLPNFPGNIESFELAVKFCYGLNFEITAKNVAQLLCLSTYLEMTEKHSQFNLVSRTESYIDSIVCKSLEMSIEVLQQCKNLFPFAEELKIIDKCVETISSKACFEQIASSFSRLEYSSSGRLHMNKKTVKEKDWWIEDLSLLDIDMYKRVIESMKNRGIRLESIGASLVDYMEKLLVRKSKYIHFDEANVVETIATLLPIEKLVVPLSFIFSLLRSALNLECSMSCIIHLERRIGLHLEDATLDDFLMFDVDTIRRIVVIFVEQDVSEDENSEYSCDSLNEESENALVKVSRLVDGYLNEIALDTNIKLDKFISVAETLPGFARTVDDGLYHAVDTYLKAHQGLADSEKKRLCNLMDFHKLSEEATDHASQNKHLSLQATIQVLLIEQLRLRDALSLSSSAEVSTLKTTRTCMSPKDNYMSLKRENHELKLELIKMKERLSNLEKGHDCIKREFEKSGSKKIINSVFRKFGRLNVLRRSK